MTGDKRTDGAGACGAVAQGRRPQVVAADAEVVDSARVGRGVVAGELADLRRVRARRSAAIAGALIIYLGTTWAKSNQGRGG
jgi:hypothetical protein